MSEHERVAGNVRVNVPGSSVEPIGEFRDRGSLSAPFGEFAELVRRPRCTDTKDLAGRLCSDGRCGEFGRVLNLCERGMLLESSSDLAEAVGFELVGPGFRYAGVAAVVHRQDGAVGLRFLSWDGPVERPVGALVAARLRGMLPGLHDRGTLGVRPPKMWDFGGDDRVAVSGLSAVIEASPGAATRRHQVLNVSEQGMLIDGLALAPVGARISFVLAGRGVSHVGCGRVAHWTESSAGVAVDHWDGAPEAIRGLVAGEIGRGSRLVDAYITDWS